MIGHKQKGDFDQARMHDVGGNKKAHAKGESLSRTGSQTECRQRRQTLTLRLPLLLFGHLSER